MANKKDILMKKIELPFSSTRFEYDEPHLYFLPDSLFSKLEKMKSVFVIGSRGTGKTTLLRALSWNEHLNNPFLIKELSNNNFKKKYIGIYLKVPEYNLYAIEDWLIHESQQIKFSVFKLFFELIWLEEAMDAITELSLNKILLLSPDNEHNIINCIIEEFPEIEQTIGALTKPCSVKRFGRVLRQIRRSFVKYSAMNISIKELYRSCPLLNVNDFSNKIAKLFTDLFSKASSLKKDKWHFKICLDEAECLSEFHRVVLNTIVRNTSFPVIYVVSYVSRTIDMMSTLIQNLTLSNADRDLIKLDEMKDSDFQELATGVATVRSRRILEKPNIKLNLEKILGKLNINSLLLVLLRRSESERAKDLIKRGQNLLNEEFFLFGDYQIENLPVKKSKKAPLIYEAYIMEKLKLPLPKREDPRWKRRAQSSRELRKKMVAAYLSICDEFNIQVNYAYAEMLFQISDNCIRDFLNQLDCIFRFSKIELSDFVRKSISIETQNAALRDASEAKWDSLPLLVANWPSEIRKIVDGLAQITAIIQKKGPENRSLRSSERGRFVLGMRNIAEQRAKQVFSNLKEASEAGFLKIIEGDYRECKFRVHCSLAPKYEFSYRGAYYNTPLSVSDIQNLIDSKDDIELNEWVKQISDKLSGEELYRLPLFDKE